MIYLKLILISVILIGIVFMAFGIRLLFNRNANVRISSCNAFNDDGISCACGTEGCCSDENKI